MPLYSVAIARLCVNGTHRHEQATWLCAAERWATKDGRFSELLHIPMRQVPADVARNRIVKRAQARKMDFLFQIDDDMDIPEGFFGLALNFLIAQPRPSVIAVPYCMGPPLEKVNVFDWQTSETGAPSPGVIIHNITREDAARRKGIEEIGNIGTGCVAYDMRVFNAVKPPYYAYQYNDDHTDVNETEDTYCHRRLSFAGVPLYCAWKDPVTGVDMWGDHFKIKRVTKPGKITAEGANQLIREQALAAQQESHHGGNRPG